MSKHKQSIERMKDILRSHDIDMSVGGCGCCGSPWVEFKYRGQYIHGEYQGDDDQSGFDTSEEVDLTGTPAEETWTQEQWTEYYESINVDTDSPDSVWRNSDVEKEMENGA